VSGADPKKGLFYGSVDAQLSDGTHLGRLGMSCDGEGPPDPSRDSLIWMVDLRAGNSLYHQDTGRLQTAAPNQLLNAPRSSLA
jgi:hypothetical protein